jgi:penicillin V acylase-like amidase (Ntn superfamily)
MKARHVFTFLLATLTAAAAAEACSRIVHTSKDGQFVVVGRSMDWFEDIRSNLWVFPRGTERTANVKQNPLTWTSRYGSIGTAGFDVGIADGLNEKGLVVNLLYLAESDYGPRDPARPGVSWAEYPQYLLDSYATVAELVESEQTKNLQIVTSPLPGSVAIPPALHFSVSDATGDSAIIQFLDGGQRVVHHDKQYTVMTNSPPFAQQLAINIYWKDVDGETMLPGTRRAADRFVRACFYGQRLPDPRSTREAVANVMSVVRTVSVPFGVVDPQRPNLSQTIWRTVADSKGLVYFFESTSGPGIVWVKLGELDLSEGQPVRKLQLAGNPDLTGDQTANLKPAEMFRFAGEN